MTLFPTTRWGAILELRGDPERRRKLVESLVHDYRQPLVVYARRCGVDSASAEDAVQGFLTRWLEHDLGQQLDPAKGRLRSYLRTALRRYLADLHARSTAQKRGGAVPALDLAEIDPRASDATTPEQAYDRAFARHVLSRAFHELEQEFSCGRRSGPFAAVREFFSPHAGATHAELALKYRMTETQMASFLHRARGRFRELVRNQVRELVTDPQQTDAEMRTLLEALS